MARCNCGGSCGCSFTAGDNIVIGGTGAPGNPITISSHTDCAEARLCFSGGDGIDYNSATGEFSTDLSPAAGNTIVIDGSGGLFVPTGSNAVTPGCGLTGDGTPGSPIRPQGKPWAYPCPQNLTQQTGIYCDPNTGFMHGDPPFQEMVYTISENIVLLATPILIPVPETNIQLMTLQITNPDPCRTARVYTNYGVDCDVQLPPNSGGCYGVNGDDLVYVGNQGSGTIIGTQFQVNKVVTGTIAPGATQIISADLFISRGSGGATITRTQWIIHSIVTSIT